MQRLFMIAGAVVCTLTSLQCSSDKKTDKPSYTPSSLNAIYSEGSIAALHGTGEIRADRITRAADSSSDGSFALNEYRLVRPGRVLSDEEAARLRKLLLDPNSYTTMPYMCAFDAQVAFTLAGSDSSYYFVLANDCHLAALQTAHSREDVNLTEKTSTVLGAFCEALFQ